MKNRLRLAAVGLLWAAGVGAAQAASPVTVAVQPDNPGRVLPADYVGVSYEMQRLLPDASGTYYFRADNLPLVNTFKTMGIKSLRIGGNTADRPTVKFPSESDIDTFFGFAKAADVQVIFTFRLRQGKPEDAARLAKYIMERYKDRVAGFSVGNEPNVFTSDYNVFLNTWKRFQTAILEAAPDAKFFGPSSTAGKAVWAKDFATEFASSGKIAGITYHLYPGGNSELIADNGKARELMLSTKWVGDYEKMANGFVPTVLEKKLSYRVEECNSFWNGGAKDVSDTHAAGIWALDYMWWWASRGAGGMNFHTGDEVAKREENTPCYYALFWTKGNGYEAHPVGYAMAAFSEAFGRGQGAWVNTSVPQNADALNLTAFSVVQPDKTLLLTVINKEIGEKARASEVTLTLPAGYSKLETLRLEAPGGDAAAKMDTRLGGAPIELDGTWKGQWTAAPAGGKLTIPATSALMVRARP